MEQIKLGLRIASIVVGIIGYSAIWMWLINNRRNEKSELAWVLWKLFHAIVIALAFLWVWFQEKIMMDDRKINVWHHGAFGRYRPRKDNFPECAWSNRRRRKRHIGDILVVHEERGQVIWMYTRHCKWKRLGICEKREGRE